MTRHLRYALAAALISLVAGSTASAQATAEHKPGAVSTTTHTLRHAEALLRPRGFLPHPNLTR